MTLLTKQDVIESIAQTVEFIPYSSSDLITYINEYGFNIEEISGEVLYRSDSVLSRSRNQACLC